MTHQRRPSLRLLSLDVDGLRSASGRRSVFILLQRYRWDVVLLQELHHADNAGRQTWAEEGALTASRPTGRGQYSVNHGSAASRGRALLFRAGAHIGDMRNRRSASVNRRPHPQREIHLAGGAFKIASTYAPCTAAGRAASLKKISCPAFQRSGSSSSAATTTALQTTWKS